MGIVCVVNCHDLIIDINLNSCRIHDTTFYVSDFLTLDGNSGAIYPGKIGIKEELPEKLLSEVNQWKIP